MKAFSRLIDNTDGVAQFIADPPVLVPIGDLMDGEQRDRYVEVVQEFLTQYRASLAPDRRMLLESYRYLDMARKVVGVGSVGTRAWVVLFTGRDGADPLLLQLKEAQPSVLAPHTRKSVYESDGRRVVEGQRIIQAASDHMHGYYQLRAWDGEMHDFYVRRLWDGKASIDPARLTPKGLTAYGDGEDDAFVRAMAGFAVAYADTNEDDFARLRVAAVNGRVQVVPTAAGASPR